VAVADDLTFDLIVRDSQGTPVLQRFGRSAQQAGEDLENIGTRAEKGTGKLGSIFAAAGPALVAGAAAAGALAGAALIKGVQVSMEREVATDRLAAQLGLPPELAKEFGQIAGRLYTQGFGESIADNADAIRAVWTSGLISDDAAAGEIEKITAQAMAFADVMGKDVTLAARAAGQMVRTGLAKDGEQAFDLLTRMIQQTGDHADDLLDTMVEYSTQFREVGLDGQKALGMISQALRAGARDADTVADAIKEFAIRSKDGSATSAAGFRALKLDADKMFDTFANGGPNADKAMALVIDRLKGMKDPVAQDAAAVALFGTKAEDLQDALFAIDPTTAVNALGQVQGATDGLGVAYDNNAAKAESFKRRAEQALGDLADGILAWAADVTANDEVQEWWSDLSSDMEDVYAKHLPALKSAWADLETQLQDNKDELENAGQLLRLAGDAAGYLGRALVWSASVGSSSMSFFADHFRTVTMFFIDHFGMILSAAGKAFGWIPGLGGKLKGAQKEFDKFRERANAALGGISNRTVHVDVSLRGITNLEEQVAVRLGRREKGGPVRRGEAYIVGEKRAEIFVPTQDGTILPQVPTRGQPSPFGGFGASPGGAMTIAVVAGQGGTSTDRTIAALILELIRNGAVKLVVRGDGRVAVP
jgi:phage-related minor tail protein